jgi:hypothetical protein
MQPQSTWGQKDGVKGFPCTWRVTRDLPRDGRSKHLKWLKAEDRTPTFNRLKHNKVFHPAQHAEVERLLCLGMSPEEIYQDVKKREDSLHKAWKRAKAAKLRESTTGNCNLLSMGFTVEHTTSSKCTPTGAPSEADIEDGKWSEVTGGDLRDAVSWLLAVSCANSGVPFAFFDDIFVRQAFRLVCNGVPLSRSTMHRRVKKLAWAARRHAISELRGVEAPVGFSADVWTDRRARKFCATLAHYISNDYVARTLLIDFKMFDALTSNQVWSVFFLTICQSLERFIFYRIWPRMFVEE